MLLWVDMKKILSLAIFVGLFAVLFVPLVITNQMYFPFISGKGFVFRGIVEIIFALWLILITFDTTYRPRVSAIFGSVLAFLAVMGIATIFAENPYKSFWSNFERMEGYITLLHLAAYFVVLGTMMRDRMWNWFWHTSIGVSLFLGLYGLLQLSGTLVINQGGVRLDGTLGNAAYFAAYMLFSIFVTLFYLFSKRHLESRAIVASWAVGIGVFFGLVVRMVKRAPEEALLFGQTMTYSDAIAKFPAWTWYVLVLGIGTVIYLYYKRNIFTKVRPLLYIIPVVLQFAMLYYTATRGAMIGLVAGVTVACVLFARRHTESEMLRRNARRGLVLLLVLLVLFVGFRSSNFVRESQTLARFATLVSVESLQSQAGPRLMVWNMAWEGFKERPFIGWGQENFNFVFNKYYDPGMYAQEQWFDRTHNIFLDWLVAGGALGLLAYISLYAAAIYYIWQSSTRGFLREFFARMWYRFTGVAQNSVFSYSERVLLTALLTAYFVQNFFVFDNITTYILFFTVLAFIHQHVAHESERLQFIVPQKMRGACVILVLVLFGTILYSSNSKQVYANQTLIAAITPGISIEKSMYYFDTVLAVPSFSREEVHEQYVQVAIREAGSSRHSQEERVALYESARDAMESLITKVPNNARLLIFQASLFDAYGDTERAEEYVQRAISFSPTKQSFWRMLGAIQLNAGKEDEALQSFDTAFELAPANHELRTTYGLLLLDKNRKTRADEVLLRDLNASEDRFIPNDQIVGFYFDRYQDYVSVLEIRKAAVDADPNNPQMHLSLAAAYLSLGNNAKAIVAIQKAIELDPGFKTQGEYFISEIQAGRNPASRK